MKTDHSHQPGLVAGNVKSELRMLAQNVKRNKTTAPEMIQDLLAQPSFHAYLSPCHLCLGTLAFVSIVLDERAQMQLLQGLTRWSKGRSVHHLSSPFSPLPCSLSLSFNDKHLHPPPPPLCLSLPLFLILHIFPFPFLRSTCSLIHLSSLYLPLLLRAPPH